MKKLHDQVMRVLKETSRTFYLPVVRMPGKLQDAVASSYLCMRAIDEVEDHEALGKEHKIKILNGISQILQTQTFVDKQLMTDLEKLFSTYQNVLPEVTMRLGEWMAYAPSGIAPRVLDAATSIADRMAQWVGRNWVIKTKSDLDGYTFSVAGAVGLLLCDIWAWFDGSQMNRIFAVHLGRGLQAVNILRNRSEDLARNVDFFPEGWGTERMFSYARQNLDLAKEGIKTTPRKAYKYLVEIPLLLADATLDALERGEEKLGRPQVLRIIQNLGKPIF